MGSQYEQRVIELYGEDPSRQQITRLSKVFDVSEDEIKNILQKNGFEIPVAKRGPRPKIKVDGNESNTVILDKAALPSSENVVVAKAPEEEKWPMPEYVKEILMNQLDSLEEQIKQMEGMLNDCKSKYKVIADYIKN